MQDNPHITDSTVELVATTPLPALSANDQVLVGHIRQASNDNLDQWSAAKLDRRKGTHSLFQYPGRMVPQVQQALIQAIKNTQPTLQSVLDPYMGSATSLVAGMSQGLHCYGQDINPLAILIAHVKTTWLAPALLEESIKQTLAYVAADTRSDIDVYFPGLMKWFRSDVATMLSKIRRAIQKEPSLAIRRVLWLTLAETIRLTSNDRTSTYKLHARPAQEIQDRVLDVEGVFREQAARNVDDIQQFHQELAALGHANTTSYHHTIAIDLLDSMEHIIPAHDPLGFDLLVTSPPYGDNRTTIPYGEHAFLPLQWIDLEDIDAKVKPEWLTTTRKIDELSMGGRFHERDTTTIEALRDASPTLCTYLTALAEDGAPTMSYRKVIAFYDDFYRSLKLISNSLRPNAYLAWTLGNRRVNKMLIRNDSILREFLENLGCLYVTELERIIHSKRMPHRNRSGNTMANEQILLLRKLSS